MALVPTICPNCGATIEVNSENETGTCKYCGTSFVTEKVISTQNFSTVHNVTNNITKVINGPEMEEADDFCSRGLSHLKLENFNEAKKCFADAIKKEPSKGIYYFYYLVAISKNFTSFESYFNNLVIYDDNTSDYYFKLDYIFKLLSKEERQQLSNEYGFNFSDNLSEFVFDIANKFYSNYIWDENVKEKYYIYEDADNINKKMYNLLLPDQQNQISKIIEDKMVDFVDKELDFTNLFSAVCNLYFENFNLEKLQNLFLNYAEKNNGELVINSCTRKFFEENSVLKLDYSKISKANFRLNENSDVFNKIEISSNLKDFVLSGSVLPVFKVIEFMDNVTLEQIENFFNFYLLSTNTETVILPKTLQEHKINLVLHFRFGKDTNSNNISTKFKIAKQVKLKIKAIVKDRTGIFTYYSKHVSTEKGVYTYALATKIGTTKKQKRDLSMIGWFIAGAIAIAAIIFFAVKLFF